MTMMMRMRETVVHAVSCVQVIQLTVVPIDMVRISSIIKKSRKKTSLYLFIDFVSFQCIKTCGGSS
jgi:hypothetical protein